MNATAPSDRQHRDLVVIGASAGGVDALKEVVAGLDARLPATVCIVLHISPDAPSALARILHRAGSLPCREAREGEALRPGEILVAPPDRHLTIEDGHVHLSAGPRENGHRPAVDPLFRSAAQARDGRVVGVVLSGNRDDGSAGLALIKECGGAAIVQDPSEALYPGMPSNAIANVEVDTVARVADIAAVIGEMVRESTPLSSAENVPDSHAELAAGNPGPPAGNPELAAGNPGPPAGNPGPLSGNPGHPVAQPNPSDPRADRAANGEDAVVVCPDCGGVLNEEVIAGVVQWRCLVGHRYSPDSLADAQARGVERALETAIRALDERGALLERMAAQFQRRSQTHSAKRFRARAANARREADLVREVLITAAQDTLRSGENDIDSPDAAVNN
jgi:two-component system chemotaxis response regulator CheB